MSNPSLSAGTPTAGVGSHLDSELTLAPRILTPLVNYPPAVEATLKELLPSDDPLDDPEFDLVSYINALFPTEQSLSNIDEVIGRIAHKTQAIDDDIRATIRCQTETANDGNTALQEAQGAIETLFVRIMDIKEKAEHSEAMVKEITRDIKLLDNAKRNLTSSITTLNHLQMLVSGIDSLQHLARKRQYGEVAHLLEGTLDVVKYLEKYNGIPEIRSLGTQMNDLQIQLGEQILADFKDAFKPGSNPVASSKQLGEACLVVNVLEPKIKRDLLQWFIALQLQEYTMLFSPDQDAAWLDKIDRRYSWLKRTLVDFEQKFTHIFPAHWNVGRQICVEFCALTKLEVGKVMKNRQSEIEVKLLLFAIQRTTAFEELLNQKFPVSKAEKETNDEDNAGHFSGLVSRCFEPHLHVYIESLDKNLTELVGRFSADVKRQPVPKATDEQAAVLPCCADLFVYYKKCLLQCYQLSTGTPLLQLTNIFGKYLTEFASKVLLSNLPHQNTSGKEYNLSSLLSERDSSGPKLSQDDLRLTCVLLSSAEYCLETAVQLEEKLKSKINSDLQDKVTFSNQYDTFHNVISACIQLMVSDLEASCEPALIAMSKINWVALDSVRDTSNYINAISTHVKTTVPLIRDCLASARKYFTQFCVKFVNSFIPKFISYVMKCRPLISEGKNGDIKSAGAEQLLLDTHSLKTVLVNLPSVGSDVQRKPPASYTKIVLREMTKAEMMLKVVMSRSDNAHEYVEYYIKLLQDPDPSIFQRLLDMKGMKKVDQTPLVDLFRAKVCQYSDGRGVSPGQQGAGTSGGAVGGVSPRGATAEPEAESSRIKKLEKLIKRKL